MARIFLRKSPDKQQICVHQRAAQGDHAVPENLELTELSQDQNATGREDGSEKAIRPNITVPSPCAICKKEDRATRKYRWKLMAGLFFPFSVQALDTTIIAGALPYIASDFNQLSQLNWIVSAFNLTSAAFIPFWGQFADVFGRYAALQIALIVTIIGSALCSGAPVSAFSMLLVGRALQGIGCAGLQIVAKVVLADKVTLKENAKNNTIFTFVGGVGYGIGPVLGGYMTQANWRWCFIINIPLSAAGVVLAHFVLRSELLGPQRVTRNDGNTDIDVPQTFRERLLTIDFGGQFLFLFGAGLLVLALTWAGSYYSWSDIKVVIPLVLGAVLFTAFLVWEFFMLPGQALALRFPTQKAMVPLNLVWTRNAGLLMYINFITGMAMFAVFYFVDLYFALVRRFKPSNAGVNLIFYMPGLGVGAFIAMFACNVWPLQTYFPLFLGTVIEPLGITLLAVAIHQGHLPTIYGMLAVTGAGTGLRFMPGTIHGVGYFPKSIASIVSMMSLAIALGGTISTTFMLNIFNEKLHRAGLTLSAKGSSSFEAIASMPQDQQDYLREKARAAIEVAFYGLTAFLWLGVVAMMFMGNISIGKKGKDGVQQPDRAVKGSFLGGWLLRKKDVGVVNDTP